MAEVIDLRPRIAERKRVIASLAFLWERKVELESLLYSLVEEGKMNSVYVAEYTEVKALLQLECSLAQSLRLVHDPVVQMVMSAPTYHET